jgi:hypothetical protein
MTDRCNDFFTRPSRLKKEFDKFEKEKQTNRQKENTTKKIFQEILPKNMKTSARFDIMNKYGEFDFSTTDFMVFPEDAQKVDLQQKKKLLKDKKILILWSVK